MSVAGISEAVTGVDLNDAVAAVATEPVYVESGCGDVQEAEGGILLDRCNRPCAEKLRSSMAMPSSFPESFTSFQRITSN